MENSSSVGEYFLKTLSSGAGGWEMSCFATGTHFILQLLGAPLSWERKGSSSESSPRARSGQRDARITVQG